MVLINDDLGLRLAGYVFLNADYLKIRSIVRLCFADADPWTELMMDCSGKRYLQSKCCRGQTVC